ncbi:MAG: TonB-dependent receptor, partial [Caulobacterales bacterium]|nr:TonB-dependent receptor [Caulobacterales bacterium]
MKSNFKNRILKGLMATTAITPFIAFSPVMAQEQKVEADKGSETVVVTARRREETLKDVPIAVSTFSAAKLENTGAADITALQKSTPNLTMQVARGTNSTLIGFIRGVGQQDPLWGFDPGVGLYVDDVYIARPQGAVLDIYDVARIEVLRGPQGTLYGRNTIGGAVKYVTKKLGSTPRLNAKMAFGSYDQADVTVSGSMPLNDMFSIGGAFTAQSHDGYGKNLTTGKDQYNKDVFAYRLSAEFNPNDAFSARLSYDNYIDNSNAKHGHREVTALGATGAPVYSGANAYLGLPTANVYDTYAGLGDKNHVENEGESLILEYKVNDGLTLKSITAARKGHTDTVIDFDGTPAKLL